MSIVDDIKNRVRNRPRFLLDKPLLNFDRPFFGAVHGVNGDLDSMVAAKRNEWEGRGYTPHQVDMAVKMAEDWANSMSNAFAPPQMKQESMHHTLPQGLDVADRWLRGLFGK
jgi:hypothetical protein